MQEEGEATCLLAIHNHTFGGIYSNSLVSSLTQIGQDRAGQFPIQLLGPKLCILTGLSVIPGLSQKSHLVDDLESLGECPKAPRFLLEKCLFSSKNKHFFFPSRKTNGMNVQKTQESGHLGLSMTSRISNWAC